MPILRFILTLMLLPATCGSLFAQIESSEKTIARTTTQEVLLDMIVRDKKAKPVLDLRQNEVTVFEDGVPQRITSFALRHAGSSAATLTGARSALPGGDPTAGEPIREPNLVSIVFEKLGPGERRSARAAASAFLSQTLAPEAYVSVLLLDDRLKALQSFTRDRQRIRSAIERATEGLYSQYSADSERLLASLEEARLSSFAGRGGGAAGSSMDGIMIGLLADQFADLQKQQGRRQLDALTILAREQYSVPGRKTVLYISGELVVTGDDKTAFRSLLSVANRNNVTFYAFDMRGLKVAPVLDPEAAQVQAQLMAAGETAVASLRQELNDSQMNLVNLAEATGGFAAANTNDFTSAMSRVAEEINTHYELAYAPSSTAWDGHFRNVRVSVQRPGVRIQTRSGYFALPSLAGEALTSEELSLLAIFDSKPLPQPFPFRFAVLQYPSAGGVSSEFVIEVPMAALALQTQNGFAAMHLGTTMFVRDDGGKPVRKISGDFPLRVTAGTVESVRKGFFTRTQRIDLAPGKYTINVAVLDRNASLVSAGKYSAVVPLGKETPALGPLTLVRKLENGPEVSRESEPLEVAGRKVTPSLVNTVTGGPGAKAVLYLVARIAEVRTDSTPEFTIDVSRDGRSVSRSTLPLSNPDEHGLVKSLASVPLEKLTPGEYQIDVRLTSEGRTVSQISVIELLPPAE